MQAPIYSAQDEMELMARLWSPTLKDDPLAFVLYTFPWGQAGTPLGEARGGGGHQRTRKKRKCEVVVSKR